MRQAGSGGDGNGMVAEALLASWRDTSTRAAIVGFGDAVVAAGSAGFVAPADRVAISTMTARCGARSRFQFSWIVTLFRLAEIAAADESVREQQPYKAATERDYQWLGAAMVKHHHGDDADLGVLMKAVERAFDGMSVDAFAAEAGDWLRTAVHPQLAVPTCPVLSCR